MDSHSVSIEAVHFATVPTPRNYVFRPEGRNPLERLKALHAGDDAIPGPCLAFVVHHPEEGAVLIDTGLHPDAHANLGRDFGTPMRFLFSGLRPVGPPFDAQLGQIGVDITEVRRVVMTHLHVDHTSAMRLLPNARFTATTQEWAAAHASRAALRGYVARHLPPESRMDLVDLEGEGQPHGPFDRTIDLLGDGTIRLVSTPGHTAGHLSVLLQADNDTEVLLVGDAAYNLRSIEEQRLSLLTNDDDRSRRSLRQLHRYREQHPHAPIIPSHDPHAWSQLAANNTGERTG